MCKAAQFVNTRIAVYELGGYSVPLVNTKNAPAPSESFVCATIEHAFDTHLMECGGTHDTKFDGDVKRCVCEGYAPLTSDLKLRGVREGSARIASMASSSACRVAYIRARR